MQTCKGNDTKCTRARANWTRTLDRETLHPENLLDDVMRVMNLESLCRRQHVETNIFSNVVRNDCVATIGQEKELKSAIFAADDVTERRQVGGDVMTGSRRQGIGDAVDGRRRAGCGVENELNSLTMKSGG